VGGSINLSPISSKVIHIEKGQFPFMVVSSPFLLVVPEASTDYAGNIIDHIKRKFSTVNRQWYPRLKAHLIRYFWISLSFLWREYWCSMNSEDTKQFYYEPFLFLIGNKKNKSSSELSEVYEQLRASENLAISKEEQGYSEEAPPMKNQLHRRCRNEKERSFSGNIMDG